MGHDSLNLTEIRWHSRGGQGGLTASQLLAEAAFDEGYEATAFSFYGAERRGAPVTSFNRVSEHPIKLYSHVSTPDIVVVLDESLFSVEDPLAGMQDYGVLVVNTTDPAEVPFDGEMVAVDATHIALDQGLERDGVPIVNTPMLGAVAHTGVVGIDAVAAVVRRTFGEANERAVRTAYDTGMEVVQ